MFKKSVQEILVNCKTVAADINHACHFTVLLAYREMQHVPRGKADARCHL